jgi:hypothetical protein
MANLKDMRYPKFSHEIVNNPQILAQNNQQDAIHEVPPEQEEAESQGSHIYQQETDQDQHQQD